MTPTSVSVMIQVARHWDCRDDVENAMVAVAASCERVAVKWDSATRPESFEKWTSQSWPMCIPIPEP